MTAATATLNDDTPPPGPTADAQRIAALETANRALDARNHQLAAELRTVMAEIAELAEQAGVFIGMASQAKVHAIAVRIGETLLKPPAPIAQLQGQG